MPNWIKPTIEMDISFAYSRPRMRKICTGHHVGLVGPTLDHVASCWHTRYHVFVTPHQSKRSTSRRIGCRHVFSTRIQGPTTRQTASNWPIHRKPPPTDPYIENRLRDPPGSHLDERQRDQSWPGIDRPHRLANPTLRRFTPVFHVLSPHWILRAFPWCLECSRTVTRAYK
jgi:hypothetical protein